MRASGNVKGRILKGVGTEKRGWETKILKRGRKLAQGVVALKRGRGLESSYEL